MCRFYRLPKAMPVHVVQVDLRGACRRYPQAMAKNPEEWCGEFKTRGTAT